MDDPTTLAGDCWALGVRVNPVESTLLGIHDHDEELPDISEEGQGRAAEAFAHLAARVEAVPRAGLGTQDLVTLDVVAHAARSMGAELSSGALEYTVAPTITGAHAPLFEYLPSMVPSEPAHAEAVVVRYRRVPAYLAQAADRLRAGVARGRAPVARGVEQSVAQIDAYLARDLDHDVLLRVPPPPGWAGATNWCDTLRVAVVSEVRPALQRYRDVLHHEILPHARPPERSGLCWLPGGEEYYAAAAAAFTSTDLDPGALHRIGRDAQAALEEEYQALGAAVFGLADPAEVRHRLRTDEALRFRTAEEVLAHAEGALARAQEAAPRWFGRLPVTPCAVEPMAAELAADGTVAVYLPPAEDGSRPGAYVVNTASPGTKLRHEADALAFHEAVPGHHTQIALAQELEGLPALRRHATFTAFVEGWALYTERLADEMGLYPDDTARLGMLSFDSWRSGRLVVDTGIHQLGWSRQQAVDHLLEHSPLAEDNIGNEVDRYVSWPGQALAYKVGQREIVRLRGLAEQRLGDRFDLRRFHDTVLGCGSVPLTTLAWMVDRWVSAAG